jgi:SAM-dependent methyltransferase
MKASMQSTFCRGCGSKNLSLIYDFGPQPLAGSFPVEPENVHPAKRYPLDITECVDCGLWQVTNLPPIEEVFHAEYRYSSSTVPDLVRHFASYADFLSERLPKGAKILEFGCNDGVLLAQLRDRGFVCVGVDASDNVASLARAKGLEVHTGFLTPEFVRENDFEGRFDLITCSNVFAHIHDIESTMSAIKSLLKKGGLFNVEVHDGAVLAGESQFDTVYHEHLTYFTEETLRGYTAMHGFSFVECQLTPMHGGGLRFSSRYTGQTPSLTSGRSDYVRINAVSFAKTIARCRDDIANLYELYGPIDGYGAAGRAQMFINMTGTARYFSKVYDDSPLRQGRYIVGTNLPIVPYKGERGSTCAILSWNYAPTISDRVANAFDRVVTLLPEMKVWKC